MSHIFHGKEKAQGNAKFLTWDEAADPSNGYCSPHYDLVLEAEVSVGDVTHGIQCDSKNIQT